MYLFHLHRQWNTPQVMQLNTTTKSNFETKPVQCTHPYTNYKLVIGILHGQGVGMLSNSFLFPSVLRNKMNSWYNSNPDKCDDISFFWTQNYLIPILTEKAKPLENNACNHFHLVVLVHLRCMHTYIVLSEFILTCNAQTIQQSITIHFPNCHLMTRMRAKNRDREQTHPFTSHEVHEIKVVDR